jgi:hypothetical protein
MGVSGLGIPGAFIDGVDKVKEEIAALEKKRQELYGQINLDRKIKEAQQCLDDLNIKITQARAQYDELVSREADEIKADAEQKIAIMLEKLGEATDKLQVTVSNKETLDIEIAELKETIAEEHKKRKIAKQNFDKEVSLEQKELSDRELAIERQEKDLQEKQAAAEAKISENKAILGAIEAERIEKGRDIAENKKLLSEAKIRLKEADERESQILKQAHKEKSRNDDYLREKKKELDKREDIIENKEAKIDRKTMALDEEKRIFNERLTRHNKDEEDLKTNWDIFREAQQNLERRNLKLRDREDKVKKKEAMLGVKHNG